MEQHNSIFESGISSELKQEMAAAANWGKIVSVIGFSGAALSFMVNISNSQILSALFGVIVSVILNVFMYRFGSNTGNAIKSSDQGELIEGLGALKTYFKITAIIILIVLILVILAVLGGFVGALLGS